VPYAASTPFCPMAACHRKLRGPSGYAHPRSNSELTPTTAVVMSCLPSRRCRCTPTRDAGYPGSRCLKIQVVTGVLGHIAAIARRAAFSRQAAGVRQAHVREWEEPSCEALQVPCGSPHRGGVPRWALRSSPSARDRKSVAVAAGPRSSTDDQKPTGVSRYKRGRAARVGWQSAEA
jgi:hypothetical protein